jgi:hypothetical protein
MEARFLALCTHLYVELLRVNASVEGWALFAQTSQPLYMQAPKINSPAILFRRVHVAQSYGLSLDQPYTLNDSRNGFRWVTDESIS